MLNLQGFVVVIGLEIHAQVASHSKLFSSAPNNFGDLPNSNVALLDVGFPGILPLLNAKCVEQAVKTGLAVEGNINQKSIFERKHYFYPDSPSGYQISQLREAIVVGGCIRITADSETNIANNGKEKIIRIHRIQLEQDAGKNVHDLEPEYSFIDLNRAGCPLMEIVSEPDISSANEAVEYVKAVVAILRAIGSSDANMEMGQLRVDANVSINRPGECFGNRVEIKNLNSTSFMKQAIEHEIERQIVIKLSGEEVSQETRLFDVKTGNTALMRKKEDSQDYCYFADADLFPLLLTDEFIAAIKKSLPELPEARIKRLHDETSVPTVKLRLLINDEDTYDYFVSTCDLLRNSCNNEASLKASENKGFDLLANWIVGDLFSQLNNTNDVTIKSCPIKSPMLVNLVILLIKGDISSKSAKDLFSIMWQEGSDPMTLVEKLNLRQINDRVEITRIVQSVVNEHTKEVEQYKNGKIGLFGFFVGKILQKSFGKANADIVNDVLRSLID
jgi:aspartyl-tRNA(Asn)/glutamyl-tRNA(Gln) amidotransferase subunit B